MPKMTRSRLVVQALIKKHPNMREYGFAAAIRERWPHEQEVCDSARAIRPDAFEIVEDKATVAIIEVVDDNPIDARKGDAIAVLASYLDDLEWNLAVVCYDYAGNFTGIVTGIYFAEYYSANRDANPRNVFPAVLRLQNFLDTAVPEPTKEEFQQMVDKLNL